MSNITALRNEEIHIKIQSVIEDPSTLSQGNLKTEVSL